MKNFMEASHKSRFVDKELKRKYTSTMTHESERQDHPPREPSPMRSGSPGGARSSSRMETFDRLSTPVPDRSLTTVLPPLTSTKKLTKEEEQRSIEHLFTESIAHKQKKRQQLEESVYASQCKIVKVEPDELSSIISRLYEQSVRESSTKKQKALNHRMTEVDATRKKKVLSSNEEVTDIAMRLYNTGEKDRKASQDLFEKYNARMSPPLVRSRDELAENDSRFYKGGFGRKH